MTIPVRPGMTVPLPGPLHTHADGVRELADLGYTDVWSAEADAHDAFTPLTLASVWEPRLRLGTAIVPAYTRTPACFAQCVASLADAAPGRVAIGIGTSSNIIVERWNGVPFVEPYRKVRDIVRFLRDCLGGEKVTATYDTFSIQGFRLGVRVEQQPPILLAALRPGMLRLAGREADGAITNWLAPDDCIKVAGVLGEAAGGEERELVARIFVCPSENADRVRAGAAHGHRRLPERAGVRRVPPVAGARPAAAADVGRMGCRRSQGRHGGDPGLGRRRARGARQRRAVPGDDPALLRQRCHHVGAGVSCRSTPTSRSGTPPGRWRRTPDIQPPALWSAAWTVTR